MRLSAAESQMVFVFGCMELLYLLKALGVAAVVATPPLLVLKKVEVEPDLRLEFFYRNGFLSLSQL